MSILITYNLAEPYNISIYRIVPLTLYLMKPWALNEYSSLISTESIGIYRAPQNPVFRPGLRCRLRLPISQAFSVPKMRKFALLNSYLRILMCTCDLKSSLDLGPPTCTWDWHCSHLPPASAVPDRIQQLEPASRAKAFWDWGLGVWGL